VETLAKEKRIKLTKTLFIDGVKEFSKHKDSVIFTFVSTLMTGSFMVYLSSSQHIFQDIYGLKEEFVYIFAGLAFFMGMATFTNGSLVMRFGMKRLATLALIVFTVSPLVYVAAFANESNPGIYVLLGFLAMQFLSLGFIFGNVRAITMQPIGHIAGIGASLSGFVSTVLAVPIAAFIGQFVTDTPLPLFTGFFVCGLIALLLVWVASRKEKRAVLS
jgi:DHA1 family bicyclomycin/chloramphenicol resistance-like MFS transporter